MNHHQPIDLPAEMAAARDRRTAATAAALHASRVIAVRTALRPGANEEDLAAMILHFYPKLSEEKRAAVAAEVRAQGITPLSEAGDQATPDPETTDDEEEDT